MEWNAGSPDLARACAAAIEAGFDGVETPLGAVVVSDDPAARTADVSHERKGAVIPVGSVCALAAECSTTETGAALSEVGNWLESARRLGARCLNLTLPFVIGESGEACVHSYQDSLNLAFELLHGLRFEAERTGVAIALEASAGGTLMSPVELRELIDAANSWAVGACIDVPRLAAAGRLEDWITTLGRRIHAIRVDVGLQRHPVTRTDRVAIVAALDAVSYEGLVSLTGGASPELMRSAAVWLEYLRGKSG